MWSAVDLIAETMWASFIWINCKPQFGDAFLMRTRFNELSGQSIHISKISGQSSRENIPAKTYEQLHSGHEGVSKSGSNDFL